MSKMVEHLWTGSIQRATCGSEPHFMLQHLEFLASKGIQDFYFYFFLLMVLALSDSISNDTLQNLSAFLTGIIADLVQNYLADERRTVYYLDFLNDILSPTEMCAKT